MATTPNQTPDGGGLVSGKASSNRVSGTSTGADATNEPGQYPVGDWGTAIFGGPLPSGTGAPGSGGGAGGGDPTTEPGQLTDGLTGITDADITDTGAPGTSTTANTTGGGESITYTRPGSPYSGTYKSDVVSDDTQGPRDSTQANDQGYGTGGPQFPGTKGNEPRAGEGRYQPGSGRVLRGGRAVRG